MSTGTEAPPVTPPATDPCRHCGAALRPDQEWCVECGTAAQTRVARTPRWRVALLAVAAVILVAGAAVAFAFVQLSDDSKDVASLNAAATATTAATPAPAATAPTTSVPSATEPGGTSSTATPTTPAAPGAPENEGDASGTPTTPATGTETPTVPEEGGAAPNTPTTPESGTSPANPAPSVPATVGSWPAGRTAYTAVLQSATSRAAAERTARRLAGQGIDVGVLHSDDFGSLEPGYWVVFSGHFPAYGKAEATAQRLQGQAAPGAYARLVKP